MVLELEDLAVDDDLELQQLSSQLIPPKPWAIRQAKDPLDDLDQGTRLNSR